MRFYIGANISLENVVQNANDLMITETKPKLILADICAHMVYHSAAFEQIKYFGEYGELKAHLSKCHSNRHST